MNKTTTIRISFDLKNKLETLMADRLKERFSKASQAEQYQLFSDLAQRKFGLSHSDMIKILIDSYQKV